MPIVESGSRFASPARYGDTLTIRSSVAWVKDKTFRMEHEIAVEDRLCASGFEVRAWVKRPAPRRAAGGGAHPRRGRRPLRGTRGAGWRRRSNPPTERPIDAPGALRAVVRVERQ